MVANQTEIYDWLWVASVNLEATLGCQENVWGKAEGMGVKKLLHPLARVRFFMRPTKNTNRQFDVVFWDHIFRCVVLRPFFLRPTIAVDDCLIVSDDNWKMH